MILSKIVESFACQFISTTAIASWPLQFLLGNFAIDAAFSLVSKTNASVKLTVALVTRLLSCTRRRDPFRCHIKQF